MQLARSNTAITSRGATSRAATLRAPVRQTATRALPLDAATLLFDLAERTGTVDAPITVPVLAGFIVALAGTALVPLALKPGQEASDDLIDRKGVTKTSVKDRKKK